MSTTQNPVEQQTPIKRVPVPAKEQWRWFRTTGLALLVGSAIGLGLIMALNLVLPADWQTHYTLYSGGQHLLMGSGIISAIFAGRNRYWGPMWAAIAFALIIGPAAWYGIYLLIFH